jgi:vancomycin resistance protein YoaR
VDPADAVESAESAEPAAAADELTLQFDTDAADAAVAELFAELEEQPTNATVSLAGNQIEISESETGVRCCEGDAGELVWGALDNGEASVELEVETVEPERSTEEIESWGIVEPVGGNRGWRAGQEVPGPRPGYTTWEVGSGGRAHNIGRMADEVNGSLIAPGESWSINDHVGARECPPYQFGGAIVDGEHTQVCGGGTSQFATTTLNAAYFAGLDVTGQAHSEYFSRYPRGREATMGAPGTPLDVRIENTTPYGIYIQSARHGDELTVTIWSTEHIMVADLGTTGQGNCVNVTNTRERTFPDGTTETDAFTAYYRPGEGLTC